MQRKDSLIPVAEVVSGSNGPVKAIRDDLAPGACGASPSCRSGQPAYFGASEAEPDLRLHGADDGAVQHCLAPTPATSIQYTRVRMVRTNSYMSTTGGGNKLPFGHLPRLLDGVRFRRRPCALKAACWF